MPAREKACRICKKKFSPISSFAKTCSPGCALEWVEKEKQRKFDAETRRRKEKLKTRSDHMSDTQTAFNAFIRERDRDKPCVSCGRNNPGVKMNAGHYLSVGAHPELRFCEFNVHKQCEHCNSFKSGNIKLYRKGLIERIGIDLVEWLEGPHEPLKPTIEELKFLKGYYREQTRILKRANDDS